MYDRFYNKYKDRDTALSHYKSYKLLTFILSVLIMPSACFGLFYLITLINHGRINYAFLICFSAVWIITETVFLVRDRKSKYRYVHCFHDAARLIKSFEKEKGLSSSVFEPGMGRGLSADMVFKYTLSNGAKVICKFDSGI